MTEERKTPDQIAAEKAAADAAEKAAAPEVVVRDKPSFQTENLNANLDVQVCRIDKDGILEMGYIPRGAAVPKGWHEDKFAAGVPKDPQRKAAFYYQMRGKIKARNDKNRKIDNWNG